MEDSLHYLIMANQMLVQRGLLERLKNTGLTIGQPKVLGYLKGHDGSQSEGNRQKLFFRGGFTDFDFKPHGGKRSDRTADVKWKQTHISYLSDKRGMEKPEAGGRIFSGN